MDRGARGLAGIYISAGRAFGRQDRGLTGGRGQGNLRVAALEYQADGCVMVYQQRSEVGRTLKMLIATKGLVEIR